MATKETTSSITTRDVAQSREKKTKRERKRYYGTPFLLPGFQPNHIICTSSLTLHKLHSHQPPCTHTLSLLEAIIPPCMFSWPVKSPSSQVPNHLLSLRQHAALKPERKCSIKWWTYLHSNSSFQGLWAQNSCRACHRTTGEASLIKDVVLALIKQAMCFLLTSCISISNH